VADTSLANGISTGEGSMARRMQSWTLTIALLPPLVFGCRLLVSGAWPCCEGEVWLKWNDEQRDAYVYAYLKGLTRGYHKGCFEAAKIANPSGDLKSDPEKKCEQVGPEFYGEISYYSHKVTAFYQRYPKQRFLFITDILNNLAYKRDMTLEEIHKRYPSGEKQSDSGSTPKPGSPSPSTKRPGNTDPRF
jgi:hypothetical protein